MGKPIITFGVLIRWILTALLVVIIAELPKWVITWTFATACVFLELYWYFWQSAVKKNGWRVVYK